MSKEANNTHWNRKRLPWSDKENKRLKKHARKTIKEYHVFEILFYICYNLFL